MKFFEIAQVVAVLLTMPAVAQSAITPQAVPPARLEPIAVTGQPAPGVAGGRFQFFGPAPGIGGPTEGAATIGRHGRLAFAAAVKVGTITQHGVWRTSPTGVELLVLQGDPAPGTQTTFEAFPSEYFAQSPSLAQGRVSFHASIASQGNGPTMGVWSDRFGPLALITLIPGVLPGLTPSGVMHSLQAQLVDQGLIVMSGGYSDNDDGGYIDPEQEGFWRDDGQSVQLVIRDDAPAPGCAAGELFGKGTFFAQGSFDHFDVNTAGAIAFNGYIKGPNMQLLTDEGVWYEGPGGLTLLAREGEHADEAGPGMLFGSGGGLHSFGSAYNVPVQIADNGSVIFGAGLRGNGVDHGESLWFLRNGQLAVVVKAFPDAAHSDDAPGFAPGTKFIAVYAARLNALDQVAVIAFVDGGIQGLWWDSGDGLELSARSGGAVPGVPGASFASNFAIVLDELTDSGVLLYKGTFTGPGIDDTNDTALFAARANGLTQVVVREGQPVTVAPGDTRTLAAFGTAGSSADGAKSLKLVFTDGSNGLFVAHR